MAINKMHADFPTCINYNYLLIIKSKVSYAIEVTRGDAS